MIRTTSVSGYVRLRPLNSAATVRGTVTATSELSALRCASVSRGIILWPDDNASHLIRTVWDEIASQGLPSMATHTHRLHKPHVSLTVAEYMPVRAALEAAQPLPSQPIKLLVESAGVFPSESPFRPVTSDRAGRCGFLFLACVADCGLLEEQRRVHGAVRSLEVRPWPHFDPGTWTPHITSGWGLTPEQLARALPIVLDRLPIEGWLERGGVEDGSTGEHWTSPEGLSSEF